MALIAKNTITSILCKGSGVWCWDPLGQCQIVFLESGTGYLICRSELCVFVSVEIEWDISGRRNSGVANNPTQLAGTLPVHSNHQEIFAHKVFDIDLKFKHDATGPLKGHTHRADLLRETAFMSNKVVVSLRKGRFWPPSEQGQQMHAPWSKQHEYCMSWETSPFPPPEYWISVKGGPEVNKYWEIKEFTGWQIDT